MVEALVLSSWSCFPRWRKMKSLKSTFFLQLLKPSLSYLKVVDHILLLSRIMSWTASSWIMLKIIVVLTHPDGNQFVFWCNIGWIFEANSTAGCCWRWDWFTWKQQRESRWAPLQDKCFDLYWVTLHQIDFSVFWNSNHIHRSFKSIQVTLFVEM